MIIIPIYVFFQFIIDWRSLYFIELLWISREYVYIAMLLTYGAYLTIQLKVYLATLSTEEEKSKMDE